MFVGLWSHQFAEKVEVKRTCCGRVSLSAFGPKRIFQYVAFDVAFGGKADMGYCAAYARFWTKADIDFFMQTFCVTDLP
jgi:hypothetical protein